MDCKIPMLLTAVLTIMYALMAEGYLDQKKEIEYLGAQLMVTNAKLLDCHEREVKYE